MHTHTQRLTVVHQVECPLPRTTARLLDKLVGALVESKLKHPTFRKFIYAFMCLLVCVCVCVCVCTYNVRSRCFGCIHTYIRTYRHTYIRKYKHIYIHTYIHVCIYTVTDHPVIMSPLAKNHRTEIHTCMHTYIHTCMHIHSY